MQSIISLSGFAFKLIRVEMGKLSNIRERVANDYPSAPLKLTDV